MSDVLAWNSQALPTIVSGGLFVCPGTGTHRERVLDDFELIFVRQGVLGMVESDRELVVKANTSLLLWPGRVHRGLMPYEPGLSFYWVHFVLPEIDDEPSDPSAGVVTVPQRVAARRPERLTASFDRLLHALAGDIKEPGGRLEATLLLSLILVDLHRSAAGSQPDHASAHRRSVVRRVDEYIASHLHEPLSTRAIAADLGYNPDYLSRVYHAGADETITDGIHRRRVAEARSLLTQTTMTVEEVACECGYADGGYFRRVFKRATGSTPSGFRDMYYRAKINTR